MLVANEVAMFGREVGLAGFAGAGLGCGGGCRCNECKEDKRSLGLGAADNSASWCDTWPWKNFSYLCQGGVDISSVTTEDIIKDESNYGPALSPENRRKAEQLARDIIEADRRQDPCRYSELDGMSELEKIFKCGQVNWALVGVIVVGGILIIKRL